MKDLRNELNIELARPKGAYIDEVPPEVFTDPGWKLETKMDGQRCSLQIGEEVSLLISRNRLDKLKGVGKAGKFRDIGSLKTEPSYFYSKIFNGTLLDGELMGGEGNKQDGTMNETERRNREIGEFVGFIVFDVLFWKGRDVRNHTYASRRGLAEVIVNYFISEKFGFIKLSDQYPSSKEKMKEIWAQGKEGVVFKHIHSKYGDSKLPWYKGKAERTVDAFLIGVTEGKSGGSPMNGIKAKPNGKVATFTVGMVTDNGNVVEVGKMSGLLDIDKEHGFKEFFNKYYGQVVEMTVSGWSGKAFRFPRFKRWRRDKLSEDCSFSVQVTEKK